MRLAGAFGPAFLFALSGVGRGRSLRTEQCACREKPLVRNGRDASIGNQWTLVGSSLKSLRRTTKMNPASAFRFTDLRAFAEFQTFYGEFDPGSGRTLAACLIHASRARSHC